MDTARIKQLVFDLRKDLARLEAAVSEPASRTPARTPARSPPRRDFSVTSSSVLPDRDAARKQRIEQNRRTLARRLRIGVTPTEAIMRAAFWETRKSEFTDRDPAVLTAMDGLHGYRLRNVGRINASGTVYNRMTGLPIQPKYDYRTEFVPEAWKLQ